MLKADTKEILDNNLYYRKAKNIDQKRKIRKEGNVILIISFIISLLLIPMLYFYSPYSKTFKVAVNGNVYLKDEDVLKEAALSDYFLLTFPKKIEKRLQKNPLIASANVEMKDGRIVNIVVKENKAIGYLYKEGKTELLMANGNTIDLNADNFYLIEKLPLIEGYSDEELQTIKAGFDDIDYKLINEISEIHKYPVSYDSIYLEVIMRDGNYCFLSYFDLYTLENYYAVSSGIDKTQGYACVYFDGLTNGAIASACPWQIDSNEEVED